MKTPKTLIKDIYNLVRTKEVPEGVDIDIEIEIFGEKMKELMKKEFKYPRVESSGLRLSGIGKPDRQIFNGVKGIEREILPSNTYVKFLYGHVIEELLLFLTSASGHDVTDEQKVCYVEGVKGHMDCKIDGVLTDVKSASPYGFKKFKERTLAFDDPFGYIDQLKGYAYSENTRDIGWLAMDKVSGNLCWLQYNLDDENEPAHHILNTDIAERVRYLKKMVGEDIPPEQCYPTRPEGKSGNMKLSVGCSYCDFKQTCFPKLRTFLYSNGPMFLTEVVKVPKVFEVVKDDTATS